MDRADGDRGGLRFAQADPVRRMRDLPLQIGQFDRVVIDDSKRPYPGRGQIQQQRGAEAARADHQDPGIAQFRLTDAADLGQKDVAGEAGQFII